MDFIADHPFIFAVFVLLIGLYGGFFIFRMIERRHGKAKLKEMDALLAKSDERLRELRNKMERNRQDLSDSLHQMEVTLLQTLKTELDKRNETKKVHRD